MSIVEDLAGKELRTRVTSAAVTEIHEEYVTHDTPFPCHIIYSHVQTADYNYLCLLFMAMLYYSIAINSKHK